MYIILSYSKLETIFSALGFNISVFTDFEKVVVLLLSNILLVLTILFIVSCIYKVINRVLRCIF